MPLAIEVRQSRNLACAVRSDWKELERWVSSASSWVLSSCSCGTGRDVISTVVGQSLAFRLKYGIGRVRHTLARLATL